MGNLTTGHWRGVPYNLRFQSTYNLVSMWCHAYQWKSSDTYMGMCAHKHTETEATKAPSLTATLNLMQKKNFWQNCWCCWCKSWQVLFLSQKSWSTNKTHLYNTYELFKRTRQGSTRFCSNWCSCWFPEVVKQVAQFLKSLFPLFEHLFLACKFSHLSSSITADNRWGFHAMCHSLHIINQLLMIIWWKHAHGRTSST